MHLLRMFSAIASIRHLHEFDAKTKWCPMIRKNMAYTNDGYGQLIPSGPSGNFQNGQRVGKCCASECALWQTSVFDRGYGHCGLMK